MADPNQPEQSEKVVEGTAETIDISDPVRPQMPSSNRRMRRLAIGAVVAVVAVAGVGASAWWWFPRQASVMPDGAATERLVALEARNKTMAAEFERMNARVRAMEGWFRQQGAASDLVGRLEALEQRVTQPGTATLAVDDGRLAAIGQRIAKLETAAGADALRITANRVRLLEKALAERDKKLGDLAAENQRLAEAATGLAADDRRLTEAATGLATRLARLEQTVGDGLSGASAALVLAAGQLREALTRPAPFAQELEALNALAANDAAVARVVAALDPMAATGIPTRPMLDARYDAMASRVIQAEIAPEDAGWIDRALARLAGLVTIRKTGADVEGEAVSAVLARSEAKLKTGDLAGTVTALAALQGSAAAALSPWLKDARARLAAERAATELSRHVIGRIADSRSRSAQNPAKTGRKAAPAKKVEKAGEDAAQ